jgi:hypothetical protein
LSGFNGLVGDWIGVIAVVLAVLVAILFVLLARVARQVAALEERIESITRGSDGRDLASILDAHLDKVYEVSRRQDDLDRHAAGLESQARGMVRGLGLVRFNTFEDTGGNQSFALALTDVEGNGLVLSSLHARNQTRLYVKGVAAGTPEGALSGDEAEALRLALARAHAR